MKPGPRPKLLEERFLAKVQKTDTCWYWTGARASFDGYGAIRVGNKSMRAHRASYEIFKGPIPPGMHVCHKCDMPPCVNPDHLWLGTRQENIRDMIEKGRHRNGADKVPPEIWSQIRREQWARILPEQRAQIVASRKKLLPEQWAEIQKERWERISEERRHEIAAKISAKQKGRTFTESHLANLRAAHAARRRPHRLRPADTLPLFGYGTGVSDPSHGNTGKTRSEEQKQSHSARMRDLWASGRFANKKKREPKPKPEKKPVDWSAIRKNMWANMSPEAKAARAAKIAASKRGKNLSDEHKAKIAKAHTGMRRKIVPTETQT